MHSDPGWGHYADELSTVAKGYWRVGERKAGTGRRQDRKISFAFTERMNLLALMVALPGKGQEIPPGEESGLPG
jgi:hypothetical protein